MELRAWCGLAVSLLVMTGCAVPIEGYAVPESQAATPLARPLPFVPKYPGRTNERNNGTSFEPCTAYTEAEMRALGADPGSLEDVMISESPNYRGCQWRSPDRVAHFGQTLGNEESLDVYKAKQSYRPWQPDRIINGRRVILTTEDRDGCFASFMSQRAIVHSVYSIGTRGKPTADLVAECNKAIEWATLAISKAP